MADTASDATLSAPSRESSVITSTLVGRSELESNRSSTIQSDRALLGKRRSVARFLLPITGSPAPTEEDDDTRSQRTSGLTRRSLFSVFTGGGYMTPSGNKCAPELRQSESMHSVASRASSRRSFLEHEENEALQRFVAANFRHSCSSMDSSVQLGMVGDRWSLSWFYHRAQRARLHLWLFLEEPYLTVLSTFVSVVMVSVIVVSITCSVIWSSLESEAGVQKSVDATFNIVFCAELLMRIWAFPLPLRFLWHPKNAIDFVAVLPFLVNYVVGLPNLAPRLSFVRWLSAYEAFLRLLKLSRYFWGWQLLFRAVCDSAKALVVPLFFLVVIVIFGSCTVYVFESLEEEAQEIDSPICDLPGRYELHINRCVSIRTLPDAIHFSVVCILSLSTGPFYGMQAISAVGQAMVCTLMVFGMVFMAMPIAIVGSCFAQTWFDRDRIVLLEKVRSRLQAQGYTPQDIHDVFDEVDADGSGEIEFDEFRKMIRSFNLRSLNVAKCRNLFHYFDTDCDGAINFMDFSLTLYPELPVDVDEYSRAAGNTDNDSNGDPQESPRPADQDQEANDDESEKPPVSTQHGNEKPLPSLLSTSSAVVDKSPRSNRFHKKPIFIRGEEAATHPNREGQDDFDAPVPMGQPPILLGCPPTVVGDDELQNLHVHNWRPECPQMSVVSEDASLDNNEEDVQSFHIRNWRQSCASEGSWRSSCSSRIPGLSIGMSDFSNRRSDLSHGGSWQAKGLRQQAKFEVVLHKMEARLERRIDQLMSAVVRYQAGQLASPNVGLGFLQGFGRSALEARSIPTSVHNSRRQSRTGSACAVSARSSRRGSIFSTVTSVRPPPAENKKRLRQSTTGPLIPGKALA